MASEDPMFVLNDGQGRVPPHVKAQVVDFSPEEIARLNSGRRGLHSQIIDRNRPIQVIRGEGPEAPRGLMAAPPPPSTDSAPKWNPVRRDATDELLAKQGVITASMPELVDRAAKPPSNAVVIPYSTDQLTKAGKAVPAQQPGQLINAPQPPPAPTKLDPVAWATSTVVPTPPAALPTQIANPTTTAMVMAQPVAPGGQLIKRETVTLSSPTIGKHRLKVAQVLVSETVVVLVYEDNEDATIYEPPAGSADQPPLVVEYGTEKYSCAYLGQSVSQPVLDQPGRQLLLVVLVRL